MDSVHSVKRKGEYKEGQVINKMVEEYEKRHKKEITDEKVLEAVTENKNNKLKLTKSKSGIVVKGLSDVSVRFSKCCSPVPGDEIVGFVTRGRGVSIHRTDCINIINLQESERQRLIDAEWQDVGPSSGEKYATEIKIYANNRTGLMVDISRIFTERGIDMTSMNVRTSKQGTATISVTFDIGGKEELQKIAEKLYQVESVLDVERATG